MYLYAMIDVYSRYLLGWRLSNMLSARNCYELLQECIEQHGAPEIVNTDQGSQYTTAEWEQLLADSHIRISMDGRERCKDNIWIERFLAHHQAGAYLFASHRRCAGSAARDRGLGKVL